MNLSFQDNNINELEKILYLMRSTSRLLFRRFEEKFELPPGINFTHMRTMLTLRFRGQCNMSELSYFMNLEKGSFTPVAGKLIKMGFVEKAQSGEDKRVYNLILTEAGLNLTETFKSAHHSYVQRTLARLEPDEQAEYLNLIERLNQINRKMLDDPG